jgi:epoxyqueuosine reductase
LEKGELTKKIKDYALGLGFDKVGIAEAGALSDNYIRDWLDKKYHGRMGYMANYFEKRLNPQKLVQDARSVISVAKNYYTDYPTTTNIQHGRISRYAWGDDYHDVLVPQLKALLAKIQNLSPDISGRVFIDTAPIMDKQWAVKAGIGWQGKHSNVITRDFGSWMFLGEVIIDIELDYDGPIPDYCGSCTRCIQACPTNAIVAPYVVDSNRCISYLTIELKQEYEIPQEYHDKMGNMIFGCDICQDVCPWNEKFAKPTNSLEFYPRDENINRPLAGWLGLNEEEFRKRFKKSPIKRSKFAGFIRNVKVASKNSHID